MTAHPARSNEGSGLRVPQMRHSLPRRGRSFTTPCPSFGILSQPSPQKLATGQSQPALTLSTQGGCFSTWGELKARNGPQPPQDSCQGKARGGFPHPTAFPEKSCLGEVQWLQEARAMPTSCTGFLVKRKKGNMEKGWLLKGPPASRLGPPA